MRRRDFISVLGGLAAWPLAARGQPVGKLFRIGFLRYASPHEKQFNAFRDGLRALGWIEGQNIVIEQRYAAGALDRLGELAADLVRLNSDIIVVDGSATAKAVKAATSITPIVFALATDPVSEGLATNMARPGGNLTGLTMSVGYQLAGKRVELLKDIKPNLSRIAVLAQPDNTTARAYLDDIAAVSRVLGIDMRTFEARTPDELSPAFVAMNDWQANGVVTLADALLFSQRERITALALTHGLPGVHPEIEFPLGGGLLSYGPSLADLFRRASTYVDKIFKGASPSQLPIEQPSKLELAVNLKTAQLLGLTINRDFLLRADEVIECAARVHIAGRRSGGGMASRGKGAAAVDAGGRIPEWTIGAGIRSRGGLFPPWP
jgi:ABC-type uncharacterized transport system substrate-binding protein